MTKLKDQVVVITGASSGIGLAAAREFAVHGCKLALIARGRERLEAAVQDLALPAERCLALLTDVADEGAVSAAFEKIHAAFGQVDILLNNAGTGFSTDLAQCSMADFRRIFETNLTGVFLTTRAVLPGMKSRRSGLIINISSVVGKTANPVAPLYCASKHALNGYTSGLQQQVAKDGIRVSTVSPSAVDTAYWDGREVDRSKFLTAAEVAAAVLFIAEQPAGVVIRDIDLTAQR